MTTLPKAKSSRCLSVLRPFSLACRSYLAPLERLFRIVDVKMDAEKGYLQGRFDAIPYVTSSASTLRQLMKGEDE